MALDLLICRQAFFYYPEPGQPVRVLPGQVARKGHGAIEASPGSWELLTVDFEVPKPAPKQTGRASVPEPTRRS